MRLIVQLVLLFTGIHCSSSLHGNVKTFRPSSYRSNKYFRHKKAQELGSLSPTSIEELHRLERFENVTSSEWGLFSELYLLDDQQNSWVTLQRELEPVMKVTRTIDDIDVDKGTTDSWDVLREVLIMEGNFDTILNKFRRNIALRANRVLHPARNAQIFALLINCMIADGSWVSARDVIAYVGLTPAKYCEMKDTEIIIDFDTISGYIARRMLELDLDRMAWVTMGRDPATEPSTPKSRGESVQEWLYTQVHRSDLGFRTADMVLAVARLALRQAVSEAIAAQKTDSRPIQVSVSFQVEKLMSAAGIPLDEAFAARARAALNADMKFLLPREFGLMTMDELTGIKFQFI